MQLFDQIVRYDVGPADFSEPWFQYLNRSGRTVFQYVRQIIEQWFSRYSIQEQAELRARFRSRLNVHHVSAFFELFLHELLLCLDCSLIVHPSIDNTDRSPDFLVTPKNSDSFYLEATVATFQSDEDAAAEARLNQVYDVLNRRVDSSNFFISVEIDSSPKSQPPGRKIAQFLNHKLRDLDPDEVAKLYKSEIYDLVPNWIFEHDDWSITFSPIPKKPSKRGKAAAQPLGMFNSGIKFVDHSTPLRDSIMDKATAYGELGKPYVVAVNVLEVIDEIDVMEALYGAWTSKAGPKNTRLSAVLLVRNLRPWSLGETIGCLYHNPWSMYSCVSILADLSHAVADGEKMKIEAGKSIIEILGIDWLGMAN